MGHKIFANRYLTLSPSDISKHNIANPMYQKIQSGEPYMIYTPELRARGVSADLQSEIDRVSNIADVFISLGATYKGFDSGFLVGSKNGYFFALESTADGSDIPFTDNYFLNFDFKNARDI